MCYRGKDFFHFSCSLQACAHFSGMPKSGMQIDNGAERKEKQNSSDERKLGKTFVRMITVLMLHAKN